MLFRSIPSLKVLLADQRIWQLFCQHSKKKKLPSALAALSSGFPDGPGFGCTSRTAIRAGCDELAFGQACGPLKTGPNGAIPIK